mgnify:FL=1
MQRQFTKRMPGMSNLTYPQRLLKLNIESLEIRRLRFDLTFTYKLMFGIYKLNVSDYFTARNNNILLRGHEHCISVPRYSKSVQRRNFIIDRICNVWNNLPVESTSFASVHAFNNSITSTYLIGYCRVNFR